MTELGFLSPDLARSGGGFEPRLASPLARALRGRDELRDLSDLGKIEVRGELDGLEVDAEVVRITRERALVLCNTRQVGEVRARVREHGLFVVDVSAALAGIGLDGTHAMRRLTDLDLDSLPAVGKVADVPAVVLRDGDSFRIFFPQEYGHFVAEVVVDTLAGLA
jgi:hypothetical protein